MTIPEAKYYKLRMLQERLLRVRQSAELAVKEAEQTFLEALRAEGVDPTVAYRWDDDTCALIPPAPLALAPTPDPD